MSEGTFENDGDKAENLVTGSAPMQSGGEPQPNQGDGGTEHEDSDIQTDIEDKAGELKDSTADQHMGDAMDDVDLEPPSS